MSQAERNCAEADIDASGTVDTTLAWDLPTRLFKWSLVGLVALAWISSGFEDPEMTVHKAAGIGILTLLVFRLLWGFVGGSTSRFAAFVRGPRAVAEHLRAMREGSARPYLGHNPVGGLMVVGLLAACSIQVALGLCASDGVMAVGPLAGHVGEDWASWAGTLHCVWFYALLSLAAVHIATNVYYQLFKREKLITAMVTGRKARLGFADALYVVRTRGSVAVVALAISVAMVGGFLVLTGSGIFGLP